MGLFLKIIKNNTGYSVKSWFLFGTFICGVLILLATVFVMVWDVVANDSVNTNLDDMSKIILAVSALFTAAGLPKIVGEVMEERNKHTKKQNKE